MEWLEWVLRAIPVISGIIGSFCLVSGFFLQKDKREDEDTDRIIKSLREENERKDKIIERLRTWARSRPDYHAIMDEL